MRIRIRNTVQPTCRYVTKVISTVFRIQVLFPDPDRAFFFWVQIGIGKKSGSIKKQPKVVRSSEYNKKIPLNYIKYYQLWIVMFLLSHFGAVPPKSDQRTSIKVAMSRDLFAFSYSIHPRLNSFCWTIRFCLDVREISYYPLTNITRSQTQRWLTLHRVRLRADLTLRGVI